MSFIKQKELAIALFIIPLVFILFNYYTGVAEPLAKELIGWGSILWNFSMLIGTYSMFKHRVTNLAERKEDSLYNIILFGSFFVYLYCMFANPAGYDFILSNIQTPLGMGLLVGFASTYTMLFRGSRTRTWLGVLLLISSVFTAMRQIPIFPDMWIGFHIIGTWVRDVPNAGVMRAITIGMGVGLVATLVRELTGKETSYLGG